MARQGKRASRVAGPETGTGSGAAPLTRPSLSCPGTAVVAGTFGDDPFVNLRRYIDRRIPPGLRRNARASLSSVQAEIAANRRVDLGMGGLLTMVPEADRPAVQALIQDIQVHLVARRSQLLQQVRRSRLSDREALRLFNLCCRTDEPLLDPELPKASAQVLVHHKPQKALLGWLSREFDRAIRALRRTPASPDRLRRLGLLVAFLRWVPHEWAEDLLIETLQRTDWLQGVQRLRMHVSVYRALFARPRIQRKTIGRLLDDLDASFPSALPMDLRRLLQALLVKGGEDAWPLLERRIRTAPERYLLPFVLEALLLIDKRATSRFLVSCRNDIIAGLGLQTFVELLASTGETGDALFRELTPMWEQADPAARSAAVDALRRIPCRHAAEFLLARLPLETDWPLRLRMVDVLARMATFDDMLALAESIEKDRSLLHYYVMDLTYGFLLDHPMLLLQLEDLAPLQHIQSARASVYRIYEFLHAYRRCLHEWLDLSQILGSVHADEAVNLGPDFALRANARDLATLPLAAGQRERLETALAGTREAIARYHEGVGSVHELEAILQHAVQFRPAAADNVLGRSPPPVSEGELLGPDDFRVSGGIPAGEREDALRALIEKTGRSIAFLREAILFREWFVRECPFILHEGLRRMVRDIESGLPLSISDSVFTTPERRDKLRRTFRIFEECTKQGVYLTDVLLRHIERFPEADWPSVITTDLTHRRSLVSRGSLAFHPSDDFTRHLQFTTFAHDYRYGKESLDQPSLVYLWLRYLEASTVLERELRRGHHWPPAPRHRALPGTIGPLTERMYEQQAQEAAVLRDLLFALYERCHARSVRMRVIPNLAYGLFCLAPILPALLERGIHVSFAGLSSRFCDDTNVSEWRLSPDALFPVKQYLFSKASIYGTINQDRVLVVVDGTMEPLDRHDAARVRLPKAYRGYLTYLAAVNYIRARDGYGMQNPEQQVAVALSLSPRYVANLVRTAAFQRLIESLLLCFDPRELEMSHERAGTGKTYYGLAQWNPDGMPAMVGTTGYRQAEVPCAAADDIQAPVVLFVSMNSLFNRSGVPAYFDNNPEIENPRLLIGPHGPFIDIGWPADHRGVLA